jgi:26S proteasome regulatory subunit N10
MILNSLILANDRGIPDDLAAAGPGAVGGAAGGAGTSQFEFGVDPTLDPELAMVRSYVPITLFVSFSTYFYLFSLS